jgi:hypothetical protein
MNDDKSYKDEAEYKLYLTISLESLKCTRLLSQDDLLRKAFNVIISGVNFSRGNEVVKVSIKEAVKTNYIIALALIEAEGLEGVGGATRDN